MKVKMLATTYWNGKKLKTGDTTDVDDNTCTRWVKAGIAEKLISKPANKTDKE